MDFYLFNLINQFAGRWPVLDAAAVFFAKQFEYFLLFLVLVVFWKKWKVIIRAFSAAALARFGFVELIRLLFPQARPFVENQVTLLFTHEATSSFPSGHAAFYFALAAVIYLYNKKTGHWFLGAALLISVSRVFSGVHWLSDILAGALVGIFSGWFIVKLSKRF